MPVAESIDTVTFDLWFTLISHDETYDSRIKAWRIAGIAEALADAGVEAGSGVVARAYEESERFLTERWETCLDFDSPEQVAILLRCAGISPDPAVVSAVEPAYSNAVLAVEPYLVEGAVDALEAVRAAGLKVGLISNTGRTPGKAMREVLRRLDVLDFFDVTVFSNEVGVLKPDGRIFEAALRKLDSRPSQTIHVGDHQVLDVRGAQAFGMKSVHVTRYAPVNGEKCAPDAVIGSIGELPEAIARLAG